LYLTTTGRRTGRAREIEIWFTARAHDGDAEGPTQTRYYVIAEHGDNAAWVRNARANPEVTVRVGTRTFAGRARVLDARAEPELWRAVRARSEEKYGWGEGLVGEITVAAAPRPPARPSSASAGA